MPSYVVFAMVFLVSVALRRSSLRWPKRDARDVDREPLQWRHPRDVAVVVLALAALIVGGLGLAAVKTLR